MTYSIFVRSFLAIVLLSGTFATAQERLPAANAKLAPFRGVFAVELRDGPTQKPKPAPAPYFNDSAEEEIRPGQPQRYPEPSFEWMVVWNGEKLQVFDAYWDGKKSVFESVPIEEVQQNGNTLQFTIRTYQIEFGEPSPGKLVDETTYKLTVEQNDQKTLRIFGREIKRDVLNQSERQRKLDARPIERPARSPYA